MVREALGEVLRRESDIEIVSEAGDGESALQQALEFAPEVIVLDIRLPDLNGLEVAARLKDLGVTAKIVALSAFADRRFVSAMLKCGASGYVAKAAAGTELVRAIRAVASGECYFSPEIASALAAEVRDPQPGAEQSLGRREREVLRMIAEGMRTHNIAVELHISVGTVEVHRRNIMRKLDLHTVAELTKHAIREGIVDL